MFRAYINPLYPNRVQLVLSTPGWPKVGPLVTGNALPFDPRRDLEIYHDGRLINLLTSAYDSGTDQYLLFADEVLDTSGILQVIYHIPKDPFIGAQGMSGGFALVADVLEIYDPVLPQLGVNVPIAKNASYLFYPASVGEYGYNKMGWNQGSWSGTVSSGLEIPTNSGWNTSGWNTGTFGGVLVNGFQIPAIVGWNIGNYSGGLFGEGNLDPVEVTFYAQGAGFVQIVADTGFNSGLMSANTVFGKTFIPDLIPGQTVHCTIIAYDLNQQPLIVEGASIRFDFVMTVDQLSE